MKKPVTLFDTNYIIRYLLPDGEEQFAESNLFFENIRIGKDTSCPLRPPTC